MGEGNNDAEAMVVRVSGHCLKQYRERIAKRDLPDGITQYHITVHLQTARRAIPRDVPFSTRPDRPRDLIGLRREIHKRRGMTGWLDGTVAFVIRNDGNPTVMTCYQTDPAWWEPDED